MLEQRAIYVWSEWLSNVQEFPLRVGFLVQGELQKGSGAQEPVCSNRLSRGLRKVQGHSLAEPSGNKAARLKWKTK